MIRLAVRVPGEHAELVLADLLDLVPVGVEELELDDGTVEYAVYGAPGELPTLPTLQAISGGAVIDVSTSELPDDWSERWKLYHRPILVEVSSDTVATRAELPALYVRPPWEPCAAHANCSEIVIDPGQAFGTGAHATTSLCLELLLELTVLDRASGPLLDVGSGSGVLGIAAAKLGFAPVVALDIEHESVEATRANADVNGVQVRALHGDIRRGALPWPGPHGSQHGMSHEQQPVLTANLLLGLLLELSRVMPGAPRHLIASGLLVHEAGELVDELAGRHGMRELGRRERGEWAAVWMAAPWF